MIKELEYINHNKVSTGRNCWHIGSSPKRAQWTVKHCDNERYVEIDKIIFKTDKRKNRYLQSFRNVRQHPKKYFSISPAQVDAKLLEKKFNALAKKWKTYSAHYSTLKHMFNNEFYWEIKGMGTKVIPLILEDLKKEPEYWFDALEFITQTYPQPKPAAYLGDLEKTSKDWIKWGEENKIIS